MSRISGDVPFVARVPVPPLDVFVRVVWHATSEVASGFEWVLPSGGCQLVVQLDDRDNRWVDPRGRVRTVAAAAIGGPFVEPVGLRSADRRAVAGASFHPGGVAALTGTPVRALAGTYADLLDLLGPEAERWVTAMRTAAPNEAIRVLERGLLQHLRRCSRRVGLEQACRHLERGTPVGEVADGLGISQRRFSRTFTDETGLTPKQFTRLRRFQRAMQALRSGRRGDLASLALACGFYDQAHLNHEFRAFAALSPTEVLAGRGPFQNHVQVSTSEPSSARR